VLQACDCRDFTGVDFFAKNAMRSLRPNAEGTEFHDVLRWYADRLVKVYGESAYTDFVVFLYDRADEIQGTLGMLEDVA
jgi:hypothetical protein